MACNFKLYVHLGQFVILPLLSQFTNKVKMWLNTLLCIVLIPRTREKNNLHQHILYIHDVYLSQICERSEFQGLKYHGGPIDTCECNSTEEVLPYVSFPKEESKPTLDHPCDECFRDRNVEHLLSCQVRKDIIL